MKTQKLYIAPKTEVVFACPVTIIAATTQTTDGTGDEMNNSNGGVKPGTGQEDPAKGNKFDWEDDDWL